VGGVTGVEGPVRRGFACKLRRGAAIKSRDGSLNQGLHPDVNGGVKGKDLSIDHEIRNESPSRPTINEAERDGGKKGRCSQHQAHRLQFRPAEAQGSPVEAVDGAGIRVIRAGDVARTKEVSTQGRTDGCDHKSTLYQR
jgi:hypothetical protein